MQLGHKITSLSVFISQLQVKANSVFGDYHRILPPKGRYEGLLCTLIYHVCV